MTEKNVCITHENNIKLLIYTEHDDVNTDQMQLNVV